MNPVKEKLKAGETSYGQMILEAFTLGAGPMLAAAGMEFVIYDMEHGRCDIHLLDAMIASCRGAGIVPLARVPDLNWSPISRVLDVGARGVMFPRIENRGQMEGAVRAVKYPPAGRRGVALGIAHDMYQSRGPAYFESANEDTMVIVIMETVEAFENLDAIVSAPGVDVAWMGHYDLTVSMGIPAQFEHPRFLKAMDDLVSACQRYGVAPGFLVANPDDALRWIKKGFRAISLGTDVSTYVGAVRSFHRSILTALSGQQGRLPVP